MVKPKTRVIYLYGPPAVGKLTVAKQLAKLTGYRMLHSHLFTPIASAVFDGDVSSSEVFRHLLGALRMDTLRWAIRGGVPGIILAGVHTSRVEGRPKRKNKFIEWLRTPRGARVRFVRLTAKPSTLLKRVTRADRTLHDHHKITDAAKLQHDLSHRDIRSPIRGVRSITIDTDIYKPKKAAREIVRLLKLPTFGETGRLPRP